MRHVGLDPVVREVTPRWGGLGQLGEPKTFTDIHKVTA